MRKGEVGAPRASPVRCRFKRNRPSAPQSRDQAEREALLRASNAGSGDSFGFSVALDGTAAIVAAANESDTSNGLTRNGAAYIFEQQADGMWSDTALLRDVKPFTEHVRAEILPPLENVP